MFSRPWISDGSKMSSTKRNEKFDISFCHFQLVHRMHIPSWLRHLSRNYRFCFELRLQTVVFTNRELEDEETSRITDKTVFPPFCKLSAFCVNSWKKNFAKNAARWSDSSRDNHPHNTTLFPSSTGVSAEIESNTSQRDRLPTCIPCEGCESCQSKKVSSPLSNNFLPVLQRPQHQPNYVPRPQSVRRSGKSQFAVSCATNMVGRVPREGSVFVDV